MAIPEETGCSIVAVRTDAIMHINPDPTVSLSVGGEIILIGTVEGEKRFLQLYGGQ